MIVVVYEHLHKLFVTFPLDPKFRLKEDTNGWGTEGTKDLLLTLSFPLQAGRIRRAGLHKECKMNEEGCFSNQILAAVW